MGFRNSDGQEAGRGDHAVGEGGWALCRKRDCGRRLSLCGRCGRMERRVRNWTWARGHVQANLDALHLATRVTGTPGVVARGWQRKDLPGGDAHTIVPLKDPSGDPLPKEKNNGTWRADNSGEYPNIVWEDSCSRDMMVGWALGFAATWEVIRDDPAFDAGTKSRLQSDADAILTSLRRIGPKDHDLLIWDADGRPTFHGLLHEDAIDRVYVPGVQSGFQAIMALGIVGGFAYVAENADHDRYLYGDLITKRRLHELARDNMIGLDLGLKSNYSGYNMVFTASWIAGRYLCDADVRAVVADATKTAMYDRPGASRQPIEQGQALYDLVYAANQAGSVSLVVGDGHCRRGRAHARGRHPERLSFAALFQ